MNPQVAGLVQRNYACTVSVLFLKEVVESICFPQHTSHNNPDAGKEGMKL